MKTATLKTLTRLLSEEKERCNLLNKQYATLAGEIGKANKRKLNSCKKKSLALLSKIIYGK